MSRFTACPTGEFEVNADASNGWINMRVTSDGELILEAYESWDSKGIDAVFKGDEAMEVLNELERFVFDAREKLMNEVP